MGIKGMRRLVTVAVIGAAGTRVGVARQDGGSISSVLSPVDEYLFQVSGSVRGSDMVVDPNGYAYVTGETRMPDFPTTHGAYDRTCGTDGQCNGTGGGKRGIPYRSDAFVTKLAPDGTVVYSTFFGGRGDDIGRAIAVDGLGRAYIIVDSEAVVGLGGLPISANIGRGCGAPPDTSGAYGVRRDVVVVRFDAEGSAIDYATCVGGTSDDFPQAMAVDDTVSVYVTGRTDSTDFPMVNPLQPVLRAPYDIYVAKLDPTGRQLVFSTFLGGSGSEVGNGLAVDQDRNIHVLGYSNSRDFPLVLAQQRENRGGVDIVLAKIDPRGRMLLYSTYLGTEAFDVASAIATDRSGNVFIAGETGSRTFPVTDGVFGSTCVASPIPWLSCSQDAFLVSLDPFGRLRYSTYVGGNGSESGFDVAVGSEGTAILTGYTWGLNDFPSVWPPLHVDPWVRAAFVARVERDASTLLDLQLVPGAAHPGPEGRSVGLDRRGDIYVMGEGIGSEGIFVAKISSEPRSTPRTRE